MVAIEFVQPEFAQALQPGFDAGTRIAEIERGFTQQREFGSQGGRHDAGGVGVDQHFDRAAPEVEAVPLGPGASQDSFGGYQRKMGCSLWFSRHVM